MKRLLVIMLFLSCNHDKGLTSLDFEEVADLGKVKIGYMDVRKDKLFLLDSLNKVIDSVACSPTENKVCNPTIILKDFNNDNKYDILIASDFSSANPLITYHALFSDKNGAFTSPKIKVGDTSKDFFTNADFTNYNMRISNKSIFMFQNKYNSISFYRLDNQSYFIPIAEVIRDATGFNQLSYWQADSLSWSAPKSPKSEKDSAWVLMARNNWNRPFIGEDL